MENNKMTDEEMYLEFMNDFLTISAMADYYWLDTDEMEEIINRGRDEHHSKFTEVKI